MVSSVDPATQALSAALPATASAGQQDPAGARMFADLMRGAGAEFKSGGHSAVSALTAPGRAQGSTTVDLIEQLHELHDPSDPIKAQYVMMDVLGQRMETLGKIHISVALSGGFTGIFKQLFNRHD